MVQNLQRNQYQFFPYHLVTPSPWPILLSFSLLSMAIGAVMYMHGYINGGNLLTTGFILTTYGMGLWFRDVITEGTYLGDHTKQVKNGIQLGVILFIVSEVFAFLSVFWAFFHASLSPSIEIGGVWPKLLLIILISFIFITYCSKFIKALYYTTKFFNKQVVSEKINKRMSSYMNINLDQIQLEFNNLKKEFKPENSPFNPTDFQQFINGFYQAEGTLGVYFKEAKSLRVGFYFAIGQNYTPEVAKIFILLQYHLGGIGKFKFEELSSGNKHIKFVVLNREDIIYKVKPYFSLLYGPKKFSFNKIARIYEIITKPSILNDNKLVSDLIHLIYNLNLEGQKIKLPLVEKLTIFNIVALENSEKNIQRSSDFDIENFQYPNVLFIIGLFLGDGSIYFSFDAKKSIAPKFNIKIVCEIVSLKDTEYNRHLLNLVNKSLGLNNNLYINNSSKMISLRYSGNRVFDIIIPILEENKQWLFWKESQILLAITVKEIYKTKAHLTKQGLTQLINILYSAPNGYRKPQDFWLKLIEEREL